MYMQQVITAAIIASVQADYAKLLEFTPRPPILKSASMLHDLPSQKLLTVPYTSCQHHTILSTHTPLETHIHTMHQHVALSRGSTRCHDHAAATEKCTAHLAEQSLHITFPFLPNILQISHPGADPSLAACTTSRPSPHDGAVVLLHAIGRRLAADSLLHGLGICELRLHVA